MSKAKPKISISLIKSVAGLAALHDDIEIDPGEFDSDPSLLKTKNGMLDLQTGEHRDARPEDLATLCIAADYDESAECPLFQEFLVRTFGQDKETIKFVQRLAGYSLTGSTKEQILAICLGEGATGKSTFLNLLKDILGDYAKQMPVDSLRRKPRTQSNDLAGLRSMRLVIDTEVPPGTALDEPLIKTFTGQDTINARKLYQEYFEFKPTFKLWLAANEMPTITDPTDAMWRRVIVIPFNHKVTGNKIDKDLSDKLFAEQSGILNWLVEGCLQWQKHGLKPSSQVRAASRKYERRARQLNRFLRERCYRNSKGAIGSTDLYKAYLSYAKKYGLTQKSQKALVQFLKMEGFTTKHSNQGTVIHGLVLKTKLA